MVDARQESVRLVAGAFEGWAARDLDAMIADLSEDFIQWHSHIGREFSLGEHQALVSKVLDHTVLDYHDIGYIALGNGEAVLVQCLCDVCVSGGGEARDVPFGLVYHLQGGKIVRCDEYMDGASLPDMGFLAED